MNMIREVPKSKVLAPRFPWQEHSTRGAPRVPAKLI